jgi:hypothetical protein
MLIVAMLLCALAACGCAKKKDSGTSAGSKAGKPAVTTENMVVGHVATVNTIGRFVVLNFPAGTMPAQDQRLNLYRSNVKIGEVKITGPQRGENVVADIVSGEPEVSDEARGN